MAKSSQNIEDTRRKTHLPTHLSKLQACPEVSRTHSGALKNNKENE